MEENELTYKIRGAIFSTYAEYGPGLLESVYEIVLFKKIQKMGLDVKVQVPVPLYIDNEKMEIGFRVDLLVENKVIVEIKSVEYLVEVHHKQLITYLKLSGLKIGLLVNFKTDNIANSIYRKIWTE